MDDQTLIANQDPTAIKCDDAHRYATALKLTSLRLDDWRKLWRAAHLKKQETSRSRSSSKQKTTTADDKTV